MLLKSGKDPCAICLNGVGINSIFCCGCSSCVHKRCSGISCSLKPASSFRCKQCTGHPRSVHGRPMIEVTVGRKRLELVPSFCLSSGGSCELASITRCVSHVTNFNELLPVPNSHSFPITSRGRVYNSHVRSATLIARFMGPTCGPSGADRTQVGSMLAPWTLLYGHAPFKENRGPNLIWFV